MTDYGHIDATTPVGRVFEFPEGNISLVAKNGGMVLVALDTGAKHSMTIEKWNETYTAGCTGYTDPPATVQPEPMPAPNVVTAPSGGMLAAMKAAHRRLEKAKSQYAAARDDAKACREELEEAVSALNSLVGQVVSGQSGLFEE